MAGLLSAKTKVELDGTAVKNLTSIPAFTEVKSQVETTTLDNDARVYIAGLKETPEALEFEGIYVGSDYKAIKTIADAGNAVEVKITLPDQVAISFQAEVSCGLGEVAVGEALTFTMSLTPMSEFVFDFAQLQP